MITRFFIMGILLKLWTFVTTQHCHLLNNIHETGVCELYSHCSKVQENFRLQGIRPTVCYWSVDPMVCCVTPKPTKEPTIKKSSITNDNLTTQRISEKKCLEFYSQTQSTSTESMMSEINNESSSTDGSVERDLQGFTGEFPFMAAIGVRNRRDEFELKCGGFLISENFVLTTAHCSSFGKAWSAVLTGGGILNQSLIPVIPVESFYLHPNYRKQYFYDDIALVKLPFKSNHTPACLWQSKDIEGHNEITAIGYGLVHFDGKGYKNKELRKMNLMLYRNSQCSQYNDTEFPQGIIESQICAGSLNEEKKFCQGRSGGPIFVNKLKIPYIIGLSAFGGGCPGEGPSIYTKIASYLDWIESIVWPDE